MNPPLSVVADLVQFLSDELREDFEERAGIIEFDGNEPRDRAECLALLDLLRRHPGALLGLTAIRVESRGKPAFVLTTDIDLARDRLPALGIAVIDVVDPAEVIRKHFDGTALLVRFG